MTHDRRPAPPPTHRRPARRPRVRRALPCDAGARRPVRRAVHHRRALDGHLLPAELPGRRAEAVERELLPHGRRRARGGPARLQALPARRRARLPEWDLRDDLAAARCGSSPTASSSARACPGLAGRLGYTPRHLTRVLTPSSARAARARPGAPCADRARTAHLDRRCAWPTSRSRRASAASASSTTPSAPSTSAARSSCARPHAYAAGGPRRVGRRPPASCACACPRGPRSTPQACSPGSRPRARRRRGGRARPLRAHARAARPDPRSRGLAAAPDRPAIDVEARLASLADLAPLVARVRRLFDLDADAIAIDAALAADPALAPSVAANPGIRMPGTLDPHELVVPSAHRAAGLRGLGSHVAHAARGRARRGRVRRPHAHAVPHARGDRRGGRRGAARTGGPHPHDRRRVRRLAAGELVVAPSASARTSAPTCSRPPASARGPPGYLAMRVTREPDELLGPTWRSERRGATRPPGRGEGADRRAARVGAVAQLRLDAPLARRGIRLIADHAVVAVGERSAGFVVRLAQRRARRAR